VTDSGKILKSIDEYRSYFERRIEEIASLECPPLYRKILLISIIEALSRTRYQGVKHKERFFNIILECSGWNDCRRLSLQQIFYKLKGILPHPEESPLFEEVKKRVTKSPIGSIPGLENEPFLPELEHYIKNDEEKKVVKESEHTNLFYLYRNHLVHEFREPGGAFDFAYNNELPYYYTEIKLNNEEIIMLVYPVKFFLNIAIRSLENVISYLQKENIDPTSLFEWGPIWRKV
jgi:hypothetical protein